MDGKEKRALLMRKNSVPMEYEDQIALCELLDYARILYYHVPNGGQLNPRYGKRLKKMGVKRGVPDLCIVSPAPLAPNARAVYLELKRSVGGKTTPQQRDWHQALVAEGCLVIVANGFDDAVNRLEKIGFKLCSSPL